MGRIERKEIEEIQWGFTWINSLDQRTGEIEEEKEEIMYGREAGKIRGERVYWQPKKRKKIRRGRREIEEK